MLFFREGLKVSLCLIIGVITITSCSRALDRNEMYQYIQDTDNGLIKKDSSQGYIFKVKYLPPDWQAVNEVEGDLSKNQELDNLTQSFKRSYTFILEIGALSKVRLLDDTKLGVELYSTRLDYLSKYLQDDISLIVGDSSVQCQGYLFERQYGLSPFETITIAFPKPSLKLAKTDVTVVIQDRHFTNEPLRFTFLAKDLNKVPQ